MSVGPGVPDDAWSAEPAGQRLGKAAARIRDVSGRTDIAQADLVRIADALGGQAETLSLAARLLAERPQAGADVYLEVLAEHVAAVPDGTTYPKSYRAAVLASFEIVEHEPAMQGHAATSLLALAAFLPDGPVATSALEAPAEHYPPEIRPFLLDAALRDRALSLLDRLGLVKSDGPDGTFTVPKLTKAVVRDLLAEAGESAAWQAAAAAIDAALAPVAPEDRDRLTVERPAPIASREEAIALFEQAEAMAANGRHADALTSHEAARAIFAALCGAAPDDLQAWADLAASHAKIGLTHATAGRARDGLAWLSSCREVIADLEAREPDNDLWSRYLASLDGQIAELARSAEGDSDRPQAPAPPTAPTDGEACATVHRLVTALKAPEADQVGDDDAPTMLVDASDDGDDEEPLPLEVDGQRGPPKVFTADSLFAEEAGLVPPAPPPPRRNGIISRLFGRRD